MSYLNSAAVLNTRLIVGQLVMDMRTHPKPLWIRQRKATSADMLLSISVITARLNSDFSEVRSKSIHL